MTMVRVLHVDDEADIREVVEISLKLAPDMVTRSCASGEEALVAAETWSPDVILLDVMMPAMDGPATLKRLRENPETVDIPVIFMTARAQSSELDVLRSLGAMGVIPKPFDPMTLASSLQERLRPSENRFPSMRGEFLLRVERDISTLTQHWSEVLCATAGAAGLDKMRRVAHGLAGAGGIFGFSAISTAAALLEEAVMYDNGGSRSFNDIHAAFESLKTCFGKSGGGDGINT